MQSNIKVFSNIRLLSTSLQILTNNNNRAIMKVTDFRAYSILSNQKISQNYGVVLPRPSPVSLSFRSFLLQTPFQTEFQDGNTGNPDRINR